MFTARGPADDVTAGRRHAPASTVREIARPLELCYRVSDRHIAQIDDLDVAVRAKRVAAVSGIAHQLSLGDRLSRRDNDAGRHMRKRDKICRAIHPGDHRHVIGSAIWPSR